MAKGVEVTTMHGKNEVSFVITLLNQKGGPKRGRNFVHAYFMIKIPSDKYPLIYASLQDTEWPDAKDTAEELAAKMIERLIYDDQKYVDLPIDLTMRLRLQGWEQYRKEVLPEVSARP